MHNESLLQDYNIQDWDINQIEREKETPISEVTYLRNKDYNIQLTN